MVSFILDQIFSKLASFVLVILNFLIEQFHFKNDFYLLEIISLSIRDVSNDTQLRLCSGSSKKINTSPAALFRHPKLHITKMETLPLMKRATQ
jgi:hypothetical protein